MKQAAGAEVKAKKDHMERRGTDDAESAGAGNAASDPGEMDELKEALTAKEKEAKENYDRYLRTAAELDNYRKRAAREKADTIKYGKEEIIKDILPFLDSLDRALEHADASDVKTFKEGIALMQDQLLCCLKKHGVERVESVGGHFDPNVHEALMQMESDRHEDNQIVSEMEKGYLLNGRLIRPSRVCVCKKTSKDKECMINEENGE
jgi:molecular chaperone GrpE